MHADSEKIGALFAESQTGDAGRHFVNSLWKLEIFKIPAADETLVHVRIIPTIPNSNNIGV